jgi:hypothetical protein
VSSPPAGDRAGAPTGDVQGIANAITEISERASLLVREEIELAKAEMTEKASRLARGAIIGVAAGVFVISAVYFALVGFAWLLYYYLPLGSTFTFFWGFFVVAVIMLLLALAAGLAAARAVKRGAPPTPDMAIEEARRIRETVSAAAPAGAGPAPSGAPATPAPYGAAAPAQSVSPAEPERPEATG